MKKLLSVILSVVMLMCMFIPAFAANSYQDIPIIYVRGQGGSIYDAEGNDIINGVEFDTKAVVKEVLEALAKTYATKDYAYAADCLKSILSQFFPSLGKDGELIADEVPPVSHFKGNKSNYGILDYSFEYDWRLDPIYNSELLSAHIDRVLEHTGAEKVALIGFSEGTCVCGAYLTYHGSDKVDSYTMLAPACNGIDIVGALAAGKCKFSAKTLDKFATYYLEGGDYLNDSNLEALIAAFASILTKVKVLGYGAAFLQDLYNGINENAAFSDVVLGCYPGFWSFVNDDYFDDAIEKNFGGREDEFAPLIEKIKKYHTEIFQTLPETLCELKEGGMKLNVIAKYGSASFPIIEDIDVQSDGVIELHNSSFGATSAKLGKTLKDVDPEDRYISPDKVIDASTCLFRDSTWFIEGSVHNDHNEGMEAINNFMVSLTKSTVQVTIDDYNQFMKFNKSEDSLSDLGSDDDHSSRWSGNILQNLIKFLKGLFAVIRDWLSKA